LFRDSFQFSPSYRIKTGGTGSRANFFFSPEKSESQDPPFFSPTCINCSIMLRFFRSPFPEWVGSSSFSGHPPLFLVSLRKRYLPEPTDLSSIRLVMPLSARLRTAGFFAFFSTFSFQQRPFPPFEVCPTRWARDQRRFSSRPVVAPGRFPKLCCGRYGLPRKLCPFHLLDAAGLMPNSAPPLLFCSQGFFFPAGSLAPFSKKLSIRSLFVRPGERLFYFPPYLRNSACAHDLTPFFLAFFSSLRARGIYLFRPFPSL